MKDGVEVGTAMTAPNEGVTEVGRLLAHAMDKGVDMEAMTALVALYKETAAIQARKDFDAALAAFHAECPQMIRSSKSQHATSSGTTKAGWFASLSEIVKTARPIAVRHGLTWTFDTIAGAENTEVVCKLRHVAGHREDTTVTLPNEVKGGASPQQKAGIIQTYGMRYSLIGALGITSADDDTDGAPPASNEPITDEQLANLQLVWDEVKDNTGSKALNQAAFYRFFGCTTLSDLPAARYTEALASLASKR